MSNARIVVAAAALACLSVVACDKKPDGTAPAGSASTTTATTTPAKTKTTLKFADAKAAWTAEVDNVAKMKDPMDKKIAAMMAKLPKPDQDTGRKKIWFAVDGNDCKKLELDTKDGSFADSTTAKTDCGM
jgi:hypothetical protein